MIMCPLINEKIDEGYCFDTSMVAEGLAPKTTAPENMVNLENFKEICLKCKNHRYD